MQFGRAQGATVDADLTGHGVAGSRCEPKGGKFFAFWKCVAKKNEAQAAALLRAPEEKRAEIWQKTVEKYGDKVTAKCVSFFSVDSLLIN